MVSLDVKALGIGDQDGVTHPLVPEPGRAHHEVQRLDERGVGQVNADRPGLHVRARHDVELAPIGQDLEHGHQRGVVRVQADQLVLHRVGPALLSAHRKRRPDQKGGQRAAVAQRGRHRVGLLARPVGQQHQGRAGAGVLQVGQKLLERLFLELLRAL